MQATSQTLGTVLLVDSETHITDLLRYNLEGENFGVCVVPDASKAAEIDLTPFRIALVDAMEQSFTGLDLLRKMKADPLTAHIPVIVVSHSDSEDAILEAFSAGADDYILKPFSLRELVARIRSVLRRNPVVAGATPGHATLSHGTLSIDLVQRLVLDDGVILPLTKTEFAILALLVRNKNTFFNRRQIYTEVWGIDTPADNDRVVDTNISRLRKKLGRAAAGLVNKSGTGYAIVG